MKLKRISSAAMAAVMAVSTAIVFEMPASAATEDKQLITTDTTVSGSFDDDGGLQVAYFDDWNDTLSLDDYSTITVTYDIKNVGNMTALQLFSNGNSVEDGGSGWNSTGWNVSVGDNQTLTLDITSFTNCINIAQVGIKLYSADKSTAFTGDVVVKSLTLTAKDASVAVTGVSINDKDTIKTAYNVGEWVNLTATVTPDNATDDTVTWTSSNTKIATVTNGFVQFNSYGTDGKVTITATAGGKSDSITLYVYETTTDHQNVTKPTEILAAKDPIDGGKLCAFYIMPISAEDVKNYSKITVTVTSGGKTKTYVITDVYKKINYKDASDLTNIKYYSETAGAGEYFAIIKFVNIGNRTLDVKFTLEK